MNIYLHTCLALTAAASVVGQANPPIDRSRELTITALGVVEDPIRTSTGGAWHFGTMMLNLAGNVAPSRFVDGWLQTIIQPRVVNGLTVFDPAKASAIAEFRNRWPKKPNGQLDLGQSPFRLLAIVNRPDLVQVGPNGPTAYGELRFVYCAFDPLQPTGAQNFFVIFEFGVPATSCSAIQGYAQAWHSLAAHTPGSATFNTALQAITDSVVLRQPGSSRPNQSNLNQLRTNEFELLGMTLEWNLREWNLVAAGDPQLATLEAVTTKQTPHITFVSTAAGRTVLAEYLTQNRSAILAGTHQVPDQFTSSLGTVAFVGGDAPNTCSHPTPAPGCTTSNAVCATTGTKWWAPNFVPQCNATLEDGQVRHLFALQTCSGCHFHETGTPFRHISPRVPGQESQLSSFLTGTQPSVPDLFFGTSLPHSFDDLGHRASVLQRMLALDCDPPGGPAAVQQYLATIQAEMGQRVH